MHAPASTSGIALRCTGVGSRYPLRFSAWNSGGCSSSASNEPALAFLPFLRLALRSGGLLVPRKGEGSAGTRDAPDGILAVLLLVLLVGLFHRAVLRA